jgi:hypothetical protein
LNQRSSQLAKDMAWLFHPGIHPVTDDAGG